MRWNYLPDVLGSFAGKEDFTNKTITLAGLSRDLLINRNECDGIKNLINFYKAFKAITTRKKEYNHGPILLLMKPSLIQSLNFQLQVLQMNDELQMNSRRYKLQFKTCTS